MSPDIAQCALGAEPPQLRTSAIDSARRLKISFGILKKNIRVSIIRTYRHPLEKYTRILTKNIHYKNTGYIIYLHILCSLIQYILISIIKMYMYLLRECTGILSNIFRNPSRECVFHPQSLRQSGMTTGPPLYRGPTGLRKVLLFIFALFRCS